MQKHCNYPELLNPGLESQFEWIERKQPAKQSKFHPVLPMEFIPPADMMEKLAQKYKVRPVRDHTGRIIEVRIKFEVKQ